MLPVGWERIYRQKGDLDYGVLPRIRRASKEFKLKNYTRILDLGCGTGRHSIYLAKQGFSVVASDIAPTGLDIARNKTKSLGLNNIEFKLHDMRSIPLGNNYIDGVICIWVLHHGTLEDIKTTIHEIHRILKPGGMVITDLSSVDTESYGIGKEIECNTFVGDKKDEEDVPHHYTTREELTRLFSLFQQYKIRLSTKFHTDEEGREHFSKKFHVKAVK